MDEGFTQSTSDTHFNVFVDEWTSADESPEIIRHAERRQFRRCQF